MNARDKQDVDILSLSVEELNIILKDFYTNVKSKTGEPYKKNSLWGYFTSWFTKVVQAPKSSYTRHTIRFVEQIDIWGNLYFCRRAQENIHTLSDFEIKIGADRYKYVQKITSELDKNHKGNSVISDIEGTDGKMYETPGNAMCPAASFEKYLSKRHYGIYRLFVHSKDSFVESESPSVPIPWQDSWRGFHVLPNCLLSTPTTAYGPLPSLYWTTVDLSLVTMWLCQDTRTKFHLHSYCYDTSDILFNKAWFYFIYFWCFNATFNNISAISWRPVLVVEEAGVLYHLRLRVECTLFVIYT